MPAKELVDAYGIDNASFPESFGAQMRTLFPPSVDFIRFTATGSQFFALRSPIYSQVE